MNPISFREQLDKAIAKYGDVEPPLEIHDHAFDLEDWEWPMETLQDIPESGILSEPIEEDETA